MPLRGLEAMAHKCTSLERHARMVRGARAKRALPESVGTLRESLQQHYYNVSLFFECMKTPDAHAVLQCLELNHSGLDWYSTPWLTEETDTQFTQFSGTSIDLLIYYHGPKPPKSLTKL